MTARLTQNEQVNIVDAYVNHLIPVITLAKRYNKSRHGIYKVLKRAGVDTSKRKFDVSCTTCAKGISRPKCQIRNKKHLFCCLECYYAFIKAKQTGIYQQSRQGQKIARQKVEEYFDLKIEHIVHHEDNNNFNNSLYNLKVFANQGDHIRYHRWVKNSDIVIKPLWDGAEV